jgi:hypothetical protein
MAMAAGECGTALPVEVGITEGLVDTWAGMVIQGANRMSKTVRRRMVANVEADVASPVAMYIVGTAQPKGS